MAWHLFCAKPSSEPKLNYCYVDLWEQIAVNFDSKCNDVYSTNVRIWYIYVCMCVMICALYLIDVSWKSEVVSVNLFKFINHYIQLWCTILTQPGCTQFAMQIYQRAEGISSDAPLRFTSGYEPGAECMGQKHARCSIPWYYDSIHISRPSIFPRSITSTPKIIKPMFEPH